MSDHDPADLERIARELGYRDWDAVPSVVQNGIEHHGPENITVVEDGMAEVGRRLADAYGGE